MKKLIVLFGLAAMAMACGGSDNKPAQDPSTQTTTTSDPASGTGGTTPSTGTTDPAGGTGGTTPATGTTDPAKK